MKANNTMGKTGFILSHIGWGIIAWIWYKNIWFRCLPGQTLKSSYLILLSSLAGCCIAGILLNIKDFRNDWRVFFDLLMGFGIYTIPAYIRIRPKMINIICCAAGACALIFIFFVFFIKIKNGGKGGRVLAKSTRSAARGSTSIICIGLALILVITGVSMVFGDGLYKPGVAALSQSDASEPTIDNSIDILIKLEEKVWKTLEVREKLDVLQVVANIERTYLGLSNELNVRVKDLNKKQLGGYLDSTHTIWINMEHLQNAPSEKLVDTIAHEAYHSYQHRMIEAYDSAGDELKSLLFFQEAAIVKEEFENYIDGFDDIEGYSIQTCEVKARRYAKAATEEYFERIKDHLRFSDPYKPDQ